MAGVYEFKKNIRQQRLQLIEENFNFGMQYTSVPLTEGYSKLLVNYDIHDQGTSLTPRPGLRAVQFTLPAAGVTGHCLGNEQVLAASEQYVDTKPYSQYLVLKTLNETTVGNLRTGTLALLTDTGTEVADQFPILTKTYKQATYPNGVFTIPTNAEIHGIDINNADVLARHVGTYAWNRHYYFFDPVLHKVVHTEPDDVNGGFKFVTDDPKAIRANVAVSWGYNMLLENPYNFTNTFSGAGSIIDFDGILPYNVNGKLNLTPITNETLQFKLFYAVPQNAKYHLVWEWRSAKTSDWTTIKAYDVQFTSLLDQVVSYSPPDDSIIMRVTAYGYTLVGEAWVRNTVSDATIAVGFNFDKNAYGNTTNLGEVNYTVDQASGATYWKNRMVVWGVPEDPAVLFVSDVNDPTYFPYPNNVETFDEPIKYAVNFLDYLLVFTSSKLHLLRLTEDGLGWATEVIQNNLSIADWDIHLIQVVKNMVFFRSGNYYYMIVPKASSTTGELTLAAVTRPLYYFFDNFEDSIKKVAQEMYNYAGELTLQQYYNYLDFEDVHNVYVFKTDKAEYLNICMLYNVVDRSWRIYCYGSQSIRVPYKADATQRGTICSLGSIKVGETTQAAPQLFKFNRANRSDWYIPRGCTALDYETVFAATHEFKNWQHLDTGYREHKSNFKKRYRELQFVINNVSNLALDFATDFFIDGEQRKSQFSYEVVQEVDPQSPDYGLITVEKVLADPLSPPEEQNYTLLNLKRGFADPVTAPSTTALGDSENDFKAWRLDSSTLPEVSYWKARLPVSGKGYAPRFCLTSRNEEAYELLNISYVYRDMNSR